MCWLAAGGVVAWSLYLLPLFTRSNVNSLVAAARQDDLPKFKKLLSKGVPINQPEQGMLYENALTAATRPDFTNVFYYLLQQSADVNAPSGLGGETPLMAAIVWGDQNIESVF